MYLKRETARCALRAMGAQLRAAGRWTVAFSRAHRGKIAYYACVAVALSAIACAAERYRTEADAGTEPLILPAAEIQAPEADAVPERALPEAGERLRAFSALPEWNGALGLWEAHAAVDYRLPGDAVCSLSAGTVRTVGRSGVYGGFIEVETGAYLLRYASVAPEADVEPGREIELGEKIATADDSMPGEASMGAHLHLELERAGKPEDFEIWAEGIQPGVD